MVITNSRSLLKLRSNLQFTYKEAGKHLTNKVFLYSILSSFLFLLSYVSPNRTNNGKEMWGPHTHTLTHTHTHTHTHTQPFLDSDKWWRGGVNHSGFRLNSRSRNSCSGSPPYSLADKRGRQAILLYRMHTRGAREVGKKVGIKILRLWAEDGGSTLAMEKSKDGRHCLHIDTKLNYRCALSTRSAKRWTPGHIVEQKRLIPRRDAIDVSRKWTATYIVGL